MKNSITVSCLFLACIAAANGDYRSNLEAAINSLSDKCKTKVHTYDKQLAHPTTQYQACQAMTATIGPIKNDVLNDGCTDTEYTVVEYAVCIPSYAKEEFDKLSPKCKQAAKLTLMTAILSTADQTCEAMKQSDAFKMAVKPQCTEKEYQDMQDAICGATSVFLAFATVLFCMAAHLFTRA